MLFNRLLGELQATDQAVPSPVGRERVRVRVVWFQLRLLSESDFCTNPEITCCPPSPPASFAPLTSVVCGSSPGTSASREHCRWRDSNAASSAVNISRHSFTFPLST